jgi:DNA mismatch repair protein MutS2
VSGGGVEWAQIQALLARDTHTPMGRERALALLPSRDLERIRRALGETTQSRAALAIAGTPPWEIIPDVRATLEAVRIPGAVAEPSELCALIPLLDAAARLRGYGQGIVEVAPALSASFGSFPQPRALADLLRRSLDGEGGVKDDASAALRRLRQRIRDLRREIVKMLEGYLHAAGAETTFQERYVTIRHGRYVLPVAAAAKGRVRGIVHDRSQSGVTLFVEPEGAVDINNDLVQATREEEGEVLRVLAALTDAVRAALPELSALVEGIGRLDLIFACGALAERMNAVEPTVGEERAVALRDARCPLLLAQSWAEPGRLVVPIDLALDAARPLLLITGPNAGGKTVALLTLGLVSLMAQSGLHVPARDGARLPVFTQLFAIVGDDQSVAENLSTFSAFVKQLGVVLADVDDSSLVLLDELGAGTDPDDGAALARATLEELAERGAFVIASTHLAPLKGFASNCARARNASVEFDQERLAPTFRLVYDRPGQSYALAIGARLGLPPALIARAHGYRSTQQQELQELLARMDDRDRRDAERAELIGKREAESAAMLARAEAEVGAAQDKARAAVARARAESEQLLGEVRRAVNQEWERLRQGEKTRAALDRSRGRLREVARSAGALAGDPSADLRDHGEASPGDRVEVAHLGLKGEILAVDDGTVTVRAGTLTVKVPREALRVVRSGSAPASPAPRAADRPHGRHRGDRAPSDAGRAPVSGELFLIGRTSEEARDLLEKYLDDAFVAGLSAVRIIHGKGTGTLRRTVETMLSDHPLVAEHRPGAPQEGGAGATVAVFGES